MASAKQVVFEFDIHVLAELDDRWKSVWDNFRNSCSYPNAFLTLDGYQEITFIKTKEHEPDAWRDDSSEFLSFIRKSFIPLGCCGPQSDLEWSPRGGKYQRKPAQNADIYRTSLTLSAILGEQLIHQVRGNFYYPPGGYREWHTNRFDTHGWRLYLVHTDVGEGVSNHIEEQPCAYFRFQYPDGGAVHTCADFDGCLRLFRISAGPNVLRHAVYSEGHRWSLGYVVSEQAAQTLIRMHAFGRTSSAGPEGHQRTVFSALVLWFLRRQTCYFTGMAIKLATLVIRIERRHKEAI